MPARRFLAYLILSLLADRAFGVEGLDIESGGRWRDASVTKPWSVNNSNVYGSDGHCFFDVTVVGGSSAPNRPANENLRQLLPGYITAVTPAAGARSAASFGYLQIDNPDQAPPTQVESGLLVLTQDVEAEEVDALQIDLGKLPSPHGIRIGVLVGNADQDKLSPRSVGLRSQDGSLKRLITGLPATTKGFWAFFDIGPENSRKSLILSLTTRGGSPTTLGGLVFDTLVSPPSEIPLNLKAQKIGPNSAEVIWAADLSQEGRINPRDGNTDWGHWLASHLLDRYQKNESRLEKIASHLDQLPLPYMGEPTGSGGYLMSWQKSAHATGVLSFEWDVPVAIDAVALLPLRLFLADEAGLTENAYWPGDIAIRAMKDGEWTPLAHLHDPQKELQNSLPEFVVFDAIKTDTLQIQFTDLPKRISSENHAGGFSEIFIFSGQSNIAPRAKLTARKSRQGYRVYAPDYLVDEQTPLGLPQIGPRTSGGLGVSLRGEVLASAEPAEIRLRFPTDVKIDAVRLDPAAIYMPGQAFPVRFSIELIDASGQSLQSDTTYREVSFPNPGLNPYTAYFPETVARMVRIIVHETSKPTSKANPWMQISDITPILRGEPLPRDAKVQISGAKIRKRFGPGLTDPSGIHLYWSSPSGYDGMTQAGRLLPHRPWLEGLYQRQQLLVEQQTLLAEQKRTIRRVRLVTVWTLSCLIVGTVIGAVWFLVRSKRKSRRTIRHTREQIASDLHDDVGSNLSTINLHTEHLLDHIPEPALQERLRAIFKLAKESTFGLREVLHNTAPRIGRAQNLFAHMHELADLILFEIPHTIKLDPALRKPLASPTLRKGLLLYYKEALSNIQNHAHCSQVTISLKKESENIRFLISDNGVGLSEDQLAREGPLRTLKLRAAHLHGDLQIDSKPREGTTLVLSIPMNALKNRDYTI